MSRFQEKTNALAKEVRQHIRILGGFVVLLWAIELLDLHLLNGWLDQFGIWPRHLIGLRGVLFAPFLHHGIGHLLANTVPLFTLGWLIMLRETSDFFVVSVITLIVSGVGTWFLGSPNSIHVGASGLIFGYFGFLLSRGYFERSMSSIALSVIAILFYGSLIWGVLPTDDTVSWQGHLFGFIGGVVSARLLSSERNG
ncbi:MAG: rhomboid family intramembrane serine protease [Thainema sp.]